MRDQSLQNFSQLRVPCPAGKTNLVKLHCPECRMEIPLTDVNVSNDIALCRRCGKNFSYAELASAPSTPIDLAKPPKGAWLTQTVRGFEIGASARHPVAFFLVPFACLWSGGSLIAIYGSQIRKGQFDLSESLFGLPFLFASIILGSIALLTLLGKTTVCVENNIGTVFAGLGSIGWRKRFRWDQVTEIKQTSWGTSNGRPMYDITIHAEKPVRVGFCVNVARQQFMLSALRQMVRERH